MSLAPPVYIPRHGSLAERVTEWFRKQPDEELSRADIALKFEVLQSSVPAALSAAVQQGDLQWVKKGGGLTSPGVYRLGAAAQPAPIAPTPKPTPSPTPATPPKCIKGLAHTIDGHTLSLCMTVPPPADPKHVLAAMLTAAAQQIKGIA